MAFTYQLALHVSLWEFYCFLTSVYTLRIFTELSIPRLRRRKSNEEPSAVVIDTLESWSFVVWSYEKLKYIVLFHFSSWFALLWFPIKIRGNRMPPFMSWKSICYYCSSFVFSIHSFKYSFIISFSFYCFQSINHLRHLTQTPLLEPLIRTW